jgi:hypothetical protein
MPAAPHMRGQIDIPALSAQKGQIAARALAAGQDDQLCVAGDRLPRADHHQIDIGLLRQRVQIIEIGDAGEGQSGHLHPPTR